MTQVAVPDPRVRGVGLALRDPLPWTELRQIVESAEEAGYRAVFVPEIAAREAFSTLTGLALATSRMLLGTGVVTTWSRRPTLAAMGAATVQDVSDGRFLLGVGSGDRPGTGQVEARRPVERVRAYVRVLREALAGEPVGPDDVFGAQGFTLGLRPAGGPPPVWMGALGDRMVALAGEVADGVLLNWCTPERVERARRTMEAAARRAGRDPEGLTVAVYVRACLGVDEGVALDALRQATARYAALPQYRRQLALMGLEDEGRRAAEAFGTGRPEDVPEPLVRTLTLLGDRGEALARLDAYRRAGADLVVCYPVPALEPFSSVLGTLLAVAPTTSVHG